MSSVLAGVSAKNGHLFPIDGVKHLNLKLYKVKVQFHSKVLPSENVRFRVFYNQWLGSVPDSVFTQGTLGCVPWSLLQPRNTIKVTDVPGWLFIPGTLGRQLCVPGSLHSSNTEKIALCSRIITPQQYRAYGSVHLNRH